MEDQDKNITPSGHTILGGGIKITESTVNKIQELVTSLQQKMNNFFKKVWPNNFKRLLLLKLGLWQTIQVLCAIKN